MGILEPGDIMGADFIPPDDILEMYAKANRYKQSSVSVILDEDTKFLFSFLRAGDPSKMRNVGNAVYWADERYIQGLVFMVLNIFLMENEEPERRLAALRGVVLFIYSLPPHVKVEFQELLSQYRENKGGEPTTSSGG